jgi:general secretion pathway protein G
MDRKKGFTIIELVVVIAIIAVLSSIVTTGVNKYRAQSRDAVRKAELREMQKALSLYYADNGSYPSTIPFGCNSNWCGYCSDFNNMSNYIPSLTPKYMGKLPIDPGGAGVSGCSSGSHCYLYRSDGVSYKLLAHCTPEGTWGSSDPFYDIVRPGWAWTVCVGDTACTTW